MKDLKEITAGNIIRLRQNSNITQAQLGEKLGYSDKSVSKWERAEAIPDAYVLKQMSALFGVTVDYLLDEHEETEPIEENPQRSYSRSAVMWLAVVGIWTAALLIFIVGWILEKNLWLTFVFALPVTLVTLLVLNSVWKKGKQNFYIVATLVASVLVLVYLSFFDKNWWQLFLLLVPAELLVFIAFKVKKARK